MSANTARKLQGLCLLLLGIVMSQGAHPLAAALQASGSSGVVLAAVEMMGALALVPIVLGLYRLVTEAKQPPLLVKSGERIEPRSSKDQ